MLKRFKKPVFMIYVFLFNKLNTVNLGFKNRYNSIYIIKKNII